MAGLPAAELCGVLGARAPGSTRVRKAACRILRAGGADAAYHASRNAFGRAGPITWGSIRQNQNGSLMALLAGRAGLAGARATSLRALGWFLGANPWGVRFQAGYGVEHPYHWAQRQGPNFPDGAIVGGPASRSVVDANYHGPPITLGPYDTAGAVYRDVRDDYVTNEVGINYGAGSVLLMALLSPS
jgi:endoglucanase